MCRLQWLDLSCRVDHEAAEPVGELFARHGRGVALEEVGASEDEELERGATCLTVRTYLSLDEATAEKQRAIELGLYLLGRLRPGAVGPLAVRHLAEEDWAEAWKNHFHVHRVGRRVVVKPTWRQYAPQRDDIVIELDPGMAFGTGLHPTTRLCIQALEDTVQQGARVLDLGTGSGILALAAARLGAGTVLALDVDPVAVRIARENVAANGLGELIRVEQGGSPPSPSSGPFDLIVANIIARVIAELAQPLAAALRRGGILIASGILVEREPAVTAALAAAGLAVDERRRDGDWLALLAHR